MSVTLKEILSSRVRFDHMSHEAVSISLLPRHIEIDEETFKIMWELSAPGGEAEGCFLRLQQKDYFYDGRDPHLEWMPDVSIQKISMHAWHGLFSLVVHKDSHRLSDT